MTGSNVQNNFYVDILLFLHLLHHVELFGGYNNSVHSHCGKAINTIIEVIKLITRAARKKYWFFHLGFDAWVKVSNPTNKPLWATGLFFIVYFPVFGMSYPNRVCRALYPTSVIGLKTPSRVPLHNQHGAALPSWTMNSFGIWAVRCKIDRGWSTLCKQFHRFVVVWLVIYKDRDPHGGLNHNWDIASQSSTSIRQTIRIRISVPSSQFES